MRFSQFTGITGAILLSLSLSSCLSGSSTTSSADSAEFYITGFYPPAETVSSLPTSVTVAFSESSFNSSLMENTYEWEVSCSTGTYYPTSVSVSGSNATVYLPAVAGLTTGDTCTLIAATSMVDNSGFALSGSNSVTYSISTQGPMVESFSPTAGSYATLPMTISVLFENSLPTSASVTNVDNWTYECAGSTTSTNFPTSVAFSGSVATVTLPYVGGLGANSYCTLTPSTSIVDATGYSLGGSPYATYVLTQAEAAPVGYILSPVASDRVYGTVALTASAYATGTNPSPIVSVEYYLIDSGGNEFVVGTQTAPAASGSYVQSLSTATLRNGLYSLSIVINNAAGVSITADTVAIDIENRTEETTLTVGSTSGFSFSESAPTGSNLVGFEAYSSNGTLYGIQPVWESAFGETIQTTVGQVHGDAFGGETALLCAASGNGRVSGVFGYSGGGLNLIEQIGVVCGPQYSASGSGTTRSAAAGSATGTAFELDCPSGTFVVGIQGLASQQLDQIQLVCE